MESTCGTSALKNLQCPGATALGTPCSDASLSQGSPASARRVPVITPRRAGYTLSSVRLYVDDFDRTDRIRVDGSDEDDISGATSRTYRLVDADEGKKIKVEVSFTDEVGYDEMRKSDAYPSSGVRP